MAEAPLAQRALVDQGDLGSRLQGPLDARPIDDEAHREARVQDRRLLHVLKRRNRPAVDRLDDVVDLEPRARRRRVGLDEADLRRMSPNGRSS